MAYYARPSSECCVSPLDVGDVVEVLRVYSRLVVLLEPGGRAH